MKIISQREKYLDKMREARKFWPEVIKLYNEGMRAEDIAKRFINPKTGKQYSRGHIFKIIKIMREESK